jgi:quinol monooxygenase YgiN
MLTIFFSMTVRPERQAEFREIAERLTRTSHAEDAGCIAYTFYRRIDDPLLVTLFEQWRDSEALSAHIARLLEVFGPPDTDESLPPAHPRRRLPKAFMDLFEETAVARFEPLLEGDVALG